MISKQKIKFVHSLAMRKYREREGLFVAEGSKVVGDLVAAGMQPVYSVQLESCGLSIGAEIVSAEELRKVSLLQSPQDVLALFPLPANKPFDAQIADRELVLALDEVQDPGNLGTIIRLADWFGVRHVLLSEGTADIYSPKALQATMGSIARVEPHYVSLTEVLSQSPTNYGTFLDGMNIYSAPLTQHGIIVLGNEGRGISTQLHNHITQKLHIPAYDKSGVHAESLNVAMAAAITLSEFRRRE